MNTQVVTIEKDDKRWAVTVRQTGSTQGETSILTCDKLILATGLNSKPHMPDLDMSKFDGPSFHALEMAHRHKELVADGVNHVTIIGGHKSALEAVGTAAQAGKKVEWLIREGGGPTWMLAARRPDGSSNVKIATKRATKIMQTSVYHSSTWLDRFLHSGRWWLGSWLVGWFWRFMTKQIQQDTYSKSENGRKLKPEPETFVLFSYISLPHWAQKQGSSLQFSTLLHLSLSFFFCSPIYSAFGANTTNLDSSGSSLEALYSMIETSKP